MKIADRAIGIDHPTYFIAEIGSNHDGKIERAQLLIRLAADCGADAAKFQSFSAPRIVSDYGFRQMENQLSHQALWEQSVFDVYQDYSMPLEWLPILKEECDEAGVHFLSSPYNFESVDALEPHVPAFKIGSGEIDWIEALQHIAAKGKPVILSTGASDIGEVDRAVRAILSINPRLVLMQCNTNYTGSTENFSHIHLNVLKTYAVMYPDLILGLSDHTPGLATCLGAVAIGARMIEKHFTDDPAREGPDHPHAMTPDEFRRMVDRTRELELSLGSTEKQVEANEVETVLIQRRCLRASKDISKGETFSREMIAVLRRAIPDGILPPAIPQVIGKRAAVDIGKGEALRWVDIAGSTA